MLRRRRLPVRSTIGLDRPSLASEDVIHIRTRRESEITVLPQTSQHTAGDGAAVAHSELRCGSCSKSARTSRLRLEGLNYRINGGTDVCSATALAEE
ncbi:hypothetical protein SLA2020_524500 [Shorea laevis]